uniref:Uncharacterized protein n=1 Tax=Pyrococcus abyssi TaxID=29292 RepID=A0A5J6XTK7_PYRAY|nr:hypothetical protein [Pyrococcus abyssi]
MITRRLHGLHDPHVTACNRCNLTLKSSIFELKQSHGLFGYTNYTLKKHPLLKNQ